MRERLGNAGQALILGSTAEAVGTVALAQREYRADLRGPLAAAPAERRALEAALLERRTARLRAGDETGLAVASVAGLDGARRPAATASRSRRRSAATPRDGGALAARARVPAADQAQPTGRGRDARERAARRRHARARRAAAALRADLLDTYQSRMRDALGSVAPSLAGDLPISAAQRAALAQGFWRVLASSYRAQVGAGAGGRARERSRRAHGAARAGARTARGRDARAHRSRSASTRSAPRRSRSTSSAGARARCARSRRSSRSSTAAASRTAASCATSRSRRRSRSRRVR